jgi:hypothetical protein
VRQVLNSQTSLVFKLVIQQMPVIQISLVKMLDFKQQLLMIQNFFGYYAGNEATGASFQISLVRVLVTQHQVRLVQILSVIMLGNFQ